MWTPPPHNPDVELRDHLSTPHWREAVAQICKRHDIPTADLTPFLSGSDVVWRATDWVVKLTAPRWTDEIEAEARCLRHVAGRLDVATPAVLTTGDLAGWPYVVMSFVPGHSLASVWPDLDPASRRRLAADLGRLTRALHTLDPWPEPHGWTEFWRDCTSNVARRHAVDGVPTDLINEIDPFLSAVGELDDTPRAFLHTELLDQHILVEQHKGRHELSALLDFADGRIGPPEYDLAAPVEFIFKTESGLLRTYLESYGEDPADLTPARSERMLAWALCHRFGSLKRMLRVLAPARPASLAEIARSLYGL